MQLAEESQLRKMKRIELVNLLLEITEENELIKKKYSSLKKQLENRKITIEESGSIAEAALKLNDIFSVAQAAADDYLNSLMDSDETAKNILHEAQSRAEEIVAEANHRGEQIIVQTEKACADLIAETNRICTEKLSETERVCLAMRESQNMTEQNISE